MNSAAARAASRRGTSSRTSPRAPGFVEQRGRDPGRLARAGRAHDAAERERSAAAVAAQQVGQDIVDRQAHRRLRSAVRKRARDRELGGFDERRLGLARREHRQARRSRGGRIGARVRSCRPARRSARSRPMACARSSSDTRSPPIAARQKSRSSLAAARVGEDHRQGHLAVAEIVADALAHGLGVGRIIDDVVAQLEGDAEVPAVAFERELGVLARFRDHRRNPARGGEQSRGLGADDLR